MDKTFKIWLISFGFVFASSLRNTSHWGGGGHFIAILLKCQPSVSLVYSIYAVSTPEYLNRFRSGLPKYGWLSTAWAVISNTNLYYLSDSLSITIKRICFEIVLTVQSMEINVNPDRKRFRYLGGDTAIGHLNRINLFKLVSELTNITLKQPCIHAHTTRARHKLVNFKVKTF